jgi:sortase A
MISCSIISIVSKKHKQLNSINEELRRPFFEKLNTARSERLELFYQTGRINSLSNQTNSYLRNSTHSRQPFQLINKPSGNLTRHRHKRLLDNLLLSIEILAILSLLFIAYSGFNMLLVFNQDMAKAMSQPIPTTTPSTTTFVLPSGHTPPSSPGGAKPVEALIPERLQPLVETVAHEPVPTRVPQYATRILIPAIEVDAPIVQGDGWEKLKRGVGHHIGSANPGENSNMVLSAHNDIYGEIFRYLDRLDMGDQVIVHTEDRSYTYIVSETLIVNPDHIEVLGPTNHPIVTLISCYPYLINNKRIVVTAHLLNEDH